MDDQEALPMINTESSKEQMQPMVQRDNTSSFLFSLKNRIGGLVRVLQVFQVLVVLFVS